MIRLKNFKSSFFYWKWLKGKLYDEGSELVSNTNQLKMQAKDGKYRLTVTLDAATRELIKEHKPHGLKQNQIIAKMGGSASRAARDNIEKNLGKTVITSENNLNYKYIDNKDIIENK